jgi:ADP-ribose pyrophosphatase YjhB (NUDIX family)
MSEQGISTHIHGGTVMSEFPEERLIQILYTNHRGEIAVRRIFPIRIVFTSTEWHPTEQWLLRAYDFDRQAERRFALQNLHAWSIDMQDPIRVGVGIIVVDQSRQILLGKRLASYNKGLWSVPAGHVKRGETFATAAKRELAEETGLGAIKIRLVGLNNYQDERGERQYANIDFVVEEYEGKAENKEPDLCERLEWFSLDSLPEPLSSPTGIAIQSYLTGRLCVTEDESVIVPIFEWPTGQEHNWHRSVDH